MKEKNFFFEIYKNVKPNDQWIEINCKKKKYGYKGMLKEQLKDLRFIKPQRFRIPTLIPRCKLTTLLRSGKPIDLYLYQELKRWYL